MFILKDTPCIVLLYMYLHVCVFCMYYNTCTYIQCVMYCITHLEVCSPHTMNVDTLLHSLLLMLIMHQNRLISLPVAI